ncbi:hypothetical protein EGW08_017681, partial [Elysia chlorotica]
RYLSCLTRQIPVASLSLTEAYEQINALLVDAERTGAIPEDVVRKLRKETDKICSTVTSLQTTLSILEKSQSARSLDDIGSNDTTSIIGFLTTSVREMLDGGKDVEEISHNLRLLVSSCSRPTARSNTHQDTLENPTTDTKNQEKLCCKQSPVRSGSGTDKTQTTGYEDISTGLYPDPMDKQVLKTQNPVLDPRSILSPEEHYPLSSLRYSKNHNDGLVFTKLEQGLREHEFQGRLIKTNEGIEPRQSLANPSEISSLETEVTGIEKRAPLPKTCADTHKPHFRQTGPKELYDSTETVTRCAQKELRCGAAACLVPSSPSSPSSTKTATATTTAMKIPKCGSSSTNSNGTTSTLAPSHSNNTRSGKSSRSDRRKRRLSHSLGRSQHLTGSSKVFDSSSSAAEEDFDTSGTGDHVTQKGVRGVRGRHYRRRPPGSVNRRSRSRRSSSCHSCYSGGSSRPDRDALYCNSINSNTTITNNISTTTTNNNSTNKNSRSGDENLSKSKQDNRSSGPLPHCRSKSCVVINKGSYSHQKVITQGRNEVTHSRAERKNGGKADSDFFEPYKDDRNDDIDNGGDEEEVDVDDDDGDDDDGESLKVRVNVPNEDFSDDALRIHRLRQHLRSAQKLRQKNRDVIETVVTGTGERLAPRVAPRDRSHDPTHVNIGEAYPFRSQEEQKESPKNATGNRQPACTAHSGKPKKSAGGKLQGPFKGIRNVTSHLFNHELLEAPEVKVRELTESEFEETFERRNDVTVRRRREMDAGIPWDELEFSGL